MSSIVVSVLTNQVYAPGGTHNQARMDAILLLELRTNDFDINHDDFHL
jgi:hypothetical protein